MLWEWRFSLHPTGCASQHHTHPRLLINSFSFSQPNHSSILRMVVRWTFQVLDKISAPHVLCSCSLLQKPGSAWGWYRRMKVLGMLNDVQRGHHKGSILSRRLSRGSSQRRLPLPARGVSGEGGKAPLRAHRSSHYRVRLVLPLFLSLPCYSCLLETNPMGSVIFSAPLLLPFLLGRRQTSVRCGDEILSPGKQMQVSGSAAALR